MCLDKAVPGQGGGAQTRRSKTCLDKPVLARDTHNSKARYGTATPGIAMLAMAEHHIKTNRMCGTTLRWTECTITDMNEPLFLSTTASQTPNSAFSGPKKS